MERVATSRATWGANDCITAGSRSRSTVSLGVVMGVPKRGVFKCVPKTQIVLEQNTERKENGAGTYWMVLFRGKRCLKNGRKCSAF